MAPVEKKFIGGYKHRVTGKIYHHATAQTIPSPWKYELTIRYHRETQTIEQKSQPQQTPRNTSTQVQARNIFISSNCDKTLKPTQNYKFADETKEDFTYKVIVLQKFTRCWLARQELLKRKKNILLQKSWDEDRIKRRIQKDIDWSESLYGRRLNPKTEEDFKLIFSDLQKWWEKEVDYISTVKSGLDLKEALCLLVNQEVKKIVEINKKKLSSLQKQNSELKEKSLQTAALPRMWKGYKCVVQVETSNTHRGKHLHEIYQTLCMKNISSQDRLDILATLKEVLQPYRCHLSQSLMQLADRETDLLLRDTKQENLDGLRNRIQNLFWQFAKQPIYNPQMSIINKREKSSQQILCCSSCKRFYTLESNARNEIPGKPVQANYFLKCPKCLYIENEAWIRKDLEIYKKILKFLRNDEESRSSMSGIIYILQPCDIQHLVEKIWKRESCISGSTNANDLELSRFDFEKEWTPWNCLLVTKHEAQILQKTPHIEMVYDKKFKKCIAQRHAEAKTHFLKIPRFFPYI